MLEDYVSSKLEAIRDERGADSMEAFEDAVSAKVRGMALDGIEAHRDVVADALRECVATGRYGRNQEEVATDRVLKAMGEAGELDGMTEDELELLEIHMDSFISTMRIYDREGME